MYKIMIVDDEPVIRKGLINFIDWSTLGSEVVYEAVDGIDARDHLASSHPDIVITDIKMPGMDGIELAEYIYTNFKSIKVIILTGHADFGYAHSAIKFGVVDFVLKPTDTEKILEAVKKSQQLLQQEQEKDKRIKSLEENMVVNNSEIREKFIHELLDGIEMERDKLTEKMHKLDIKLEKYYALVFEIYNATSNIDDNKKNDYKKNATTLKNVISLAFKDIEHYSVVLKSNTVCTLLSFTQDNNSEHMQTILTTCTEIVELSEGFMRYTTSVGVSHIHSSPTEIPDAYAEAINALSLRFYDDTETTIHMAYPSTINHVDACFAKKYIDNIIEQIHEGNSSEAVRVLNEMFDILKSKKYSIDDIKNVGILLCSLSTKLLGNHNLSITNVIEQDSSLYSGILEAKSISVLLETLVKVIASTAEHLGSNDQQVNYIIKKAKHYLGEHFNEDISLSSLANHVHINSSYLSRLFKKETGETITEALTVIRMEKAKELLQTTDKKTYEIASKVGIDDPAYFSQLFKKYTGLNPKDYKRNI